jgi:hypothetical protein
MPALEGFMKAEVSPASEDAPALLAPADTEVGCVEARTAAAEAALPDEEEEAEEEDDEEASTEEDMTP